MMSGYRQLAFFIMLGVILGQAAGGVSVISPASAHDPRPVLIDIYQIYLEKVLKIENLYEGRTFGKPDQIGKKCKKIIYYKLLILYEYWLIIIIIEIWLF